ncbi:hypothetical protein KJ885_00490 [Patescibacteria group bacterium]|nr:hypothetical protein [Patescibacteria group bacterium]
MNILRKLFEKLESRIEEWIIRKIEKEIVEIKRLIKEKLTREFDELEKLPEGQEKNQQWEEVKKRWEEIDKRNEKIGEKLKKVKAAIERRKKEREEKMSEKNTEKMYRTLARVVKIEQSKQGRFLRMIVCGWSPDEEVRVSFDCLPVSLRELVCEGVRLVVQANLGAKSADELRFANFRLATKPDPNDGLA